MTIDLFAGIPVKDFEAALPWYEQLFGAPPSFFPTDTEAVWELAEHRWLFIVQRPEHAGHAIPTVLVGDLDARVGQIAARGIEPSIDETYLNGTRKVTYIDLDGNEIGFGGVPLDDG